MVSLIGEEYVSFSESIKGQYSPLVAISKYDGTVAYREMLRDDILRIEDSSPVPGGYLFRKAQNASTTWVKRFAVVRADLMFFFHSPQNEKPIALLPLNECKIVTPDNNVKSFEEQRVFRANEGFEFDIVHNSRPTVRVYALTESERTEWIRICRNRSSLSDGLQQKKFALQSGANSNVFVTSTRLTGFSMASSSMNKPPSSPYRHFDTRSNSNDDDQSGSFNNSNQYPYTPPNLGDYDSSSAGQSSGRQYPPLPPQQYSGQSNRFSPQSAFNDSMSPIYGTNRDAMQMDSPTSRLEQSAQHSPGRPDETYRNAYPVTSHFDRSSPAATMSSLGGNNRASMSGGKRRGSLANLEVNFLEQNLMSKVSEQTEARRRESQVRIAYVLVLLKLCSCVCWF